MAEGLLNRRSTCNGEYHQSCWLFLLSHFTLPLSTGHASQKSNGTVYSLLLSTLLVYETMRHCDVVQGTGTVLSRSFDFFVVLEYLYLSSFLSPHSNTVGEGPCYNCSQKRVKNEPVPLARDVAVLRQFKINTLSSSSS